jgi:hypothetical protein
MVSVRTLFLLVRGIDQTGRALTDPTKKLTALEIAQKNLAASGTRLMFAAVAFGAFGLMIGRAILGTLETTSRGKRILDDFGESLNRLTKSFANAVIRNYGDDLENLITTFDKLSKSQGGMDIIAKITVSSVIFAVEAAALAAMGVFGTKIAAALLPSLAKAGLTLGPLSGVAGALWEIVIPFVIIMMVKDFIWSIAPEAWQKSWTNFMKDAQEKWKWAGNQALDVWTKGPTQAPGEDAFGNLLSRLTGGNKIGTDIKTTSANTTISNIFNFTGPINTKADIDTVDEVFGDALKNVGGIP